LLDRREVVAAVEELIAVHLDLGPARAASGVPTAANTRPTNAGATHLEETHTILLPPPPRSTSP
jgi:hypothetical protein